MIKIKQSIYIKAEINKIWAYLTDFTHSLSFNRFHTSLKIQNSYSLSNMDKFTINHNFGFGNYEMVAELVDYLPPHRLSLSEYCPDDPKKGFPHLIIFEVENKLQKCNLTYSISGTYGGRVQDMSFKPILKGVIKEELLKIKDAIESSETLDKQIISKSIEPI